METATDVFVRAYCVAKSAAHPYVPTRAGGLWVMQDGPGRKEPRKIEAVSCSLSPTEMVRGIGDLGLGWHFASKIHAPDADFKAIRQEFKSLGYRAVATEWMFTHSLADIPPVTSEPPPRMVITHAEADAIPQIAQHKRKVRDGVRLYGVWDKTRDYGWVQSVPFGEAAWVANLYVHKDARGRGFGRSLMAKLLKDDKDLGIKTSVLLASSDGARLYPHLGYDKIAVLQMFCPAARS